MGERAWFQGSATWVGTAGVMSAFAKGAPVRVIGSATVGSDDLYWYVKADSPMKSLKEATDKNLKAGYITKWDADATIRDAETSRIGKP